MSASLSQFTQRFHALNELIVFEASTQADDIVKGVAKGSIEADRLLICRAHLKIDLRTTRLTQLHLDCSHQRPPNPSKPHSWQDREVVHPATMAVITRHHRTDQLAAVDGNKKPLALHSQLACDVFARIVPRTRQAGRLPKSQNRLLVTAFKRPNHKPVTLSATAHTGLLTAIRAAVRSNAGILAWATLRECHPTGGGDSGAVTAIG